jgi:hypothetical protein
LGGYAITKHILVYDSRIIRCCPAHDLRVIGKVKEKPADDGLPRSLQHCEESRDVRFKLVAQGDVLIIW